MAVIHKRKKWVYLFEPRTASRATERLLLTLSGCQKHGAHHDGLPQVRPRIHNIDDFYVGVTVRNPIDVLVTEYVKDSRDHSFDEWIKTIGNHHVPEPLTGLWRGGNTFCWYENLQEDLRHMFQNMVRTSSRPDFDLDFVKTDKTVDKQPWWTYPSEETLNALLVRYKPFLDRFGYEFYREGGEPRMAVVHERAQRMRCRPILIHGSN